MVCWAAIAEIFGRNAGTEELEAFYPIRPECIADVPKIRFRPRVWIFYSSLFLPKFQFNSLFIVRYIFITTCACVTYLFSQVGKTLSARRWQAAFSEDGHLDIARVLRRIQRGVYFFLAKMTIYIYIFNLNQITDTDIWIGVSYSISDDIWLVI